MNEMIFRKKKIFEKMKFQSTLPLIQKAPNKMPFRKMFEDAGVAINCPSGIKVYSLEILY